MHIQCTYATEIYDGALVIPSQRTDLLAPMTSEISAKDERAISRSLTSTRTLYRRDNKVQVGLLSSDSSEEANA